MMGYGSMFGFGGGAVGLSGLLWGLGGMLLLVGLVILVVWAASRAVPAASVYAAPAQREPLELLRERFARGEISEAEFSQAKAVLGYER